MAGVRTSFILIFPDNSITIYIVYSKHTDCSHPKVTPDITQLTDQPWKTRAIHPQNTGKAWRGGGIGDQLPELQKLQARSLR